MHKLTKVFCLSLLLFFLSTVSVNATSFYVANNGNDANPGSASTPFKTIQKGINSANAGDTVIVEDGTYSSGEITISNSGTATNFITLTAQNKYGAHVTQSVSGGHGFLINGSYIKINGFDISGFDWGGFWDNQGGHDINLSGNMVRNIGNSCTDTSLGIVGMYVHSVSNITLDGNIFHDIGRLFNGQNGCTMANPTFAYNHDHALYLDGITNAIIDNNIFYNNVHGWSVQIYSSNALASNNVNILNNTFAFPNPNRNGQIILAGTLSNSSIENNIFNNPTVAGVDVQTYNNAVYTNVEVANNISTTSQITDLALSGINLSNNKLSTDPKLVNPNGFDFHLLNTSLAINSGLSLSQVTTDFDGITRPQGTGWDIGAYEFAGASSSPAPSATPIPGDTNADGIVDGIDYVIVLNHYEQTTTGGRAVGDLNNDGVVNSTDLSIVTTNILM